MTKPLVYGFSKIGPGHIRTNLPNQDSFLVKNFGSFSLLVISDGMGSKKHADIGSHAACLAVYKAVVHYVYTERKHHQKNRNIFSMIKKEWLKLISPYNPKDCSATCLFVLRSKKKCIAAMLGDGLIYLKGKKKEDSKLLIDEKKDEFSNSTVSMSDTNYLNEWRFISVSTKKITSVFMSSDGISSDLIQGKEKEFVDDFLLDLTKESTLVKKRSYIKQIIDNWPVPKHSDDKTIVIMETENEQS